MRIFLLGTAAGQIYDQITLGDILEQHENGRHVEENQHRHIYSQGEQRTQMSAPNSPTIRPKEFVNGSSFQQIVEANVEPRDTQAASAALTANTVTPVISAEESLQFLHKLVAQGAGQAEKFGRAFLTELSTAVGRREPFLSGRAPPRLETLQQAPSEMSLQQQSMQQSVPDYWSPSITTSLASTILDQSPVWPWWRSTTMLNEAFTRTAVDIMTSLGYTSQTSIDGWFGVADEWTRVLNSIADFQQRLSQALWKLQGWTVRLLLPPEAEGPIRPTITTQILRPNQPVTTPVLKPNLASSAELLASAAQRAGAVNEASEVIGMTSQPTVEFLPLELNLYPRH